MSVVTYGNRADVEFYLERFNDDVSDVAEAFDTINFKDQWTNTSGGIYKMHSQVLDNPRGTRNTIPRIAILITDGASNKDRDLTIPQAVYAREKGILQPQIHFNFTTSLISKFSDIKLNIFLLFLLIESNS